MGTVYSILDSAARFVSSSDCVSHDRPQLWSASTSLYQGTSRRPFGNLRASWEDHGRCQARAVWMRIRVSGVVCSTLKCQAWSQLLLSGTAGERSSCERTWAQCIPWLLYWSWATTFKTHLCTSPPCALLWIINKNRRESCLRSGQEGGAPSYFISPPLSLSLCLITLCLYLSLYTCLRPSLSLWLLLSLCDSLSPPQLSSCVYVPLSCARSLARSACSTLSLLLSLALALSTPL